MTQRRPDSCDRCKRYAWDHTDTLCMYCDQDKLDARRASEKTPMVQKGKPPLEPIKGVRVARNARQAREQIKFLEAMGRPVPPELLAKANK